MRANRLQRDMSQVYGNTGFLDSIQAALGSDGQSSGQGSGLPPTQTVSQTTIPTSLPSSQLDSLLSSQTSFVTITTTVVVSATATEFSTEEVPSPTTASVKSTSGSSTPTGAPVPHWGTCGGIYHLGSTVCESPYQCVVLSAWYSQCL